MSRRTIRQLRTVMRHCSTASSTGRRGRCGTSTPDIIRRLFFAMTARSTGLNRAEPLLECSPIRTSEERGLRLNPGDLVIAYTDGVVEATNSEGDEWGVQGLLRAAAAWAPQRPGVAQDLVRWLFNSMDDFSNGFQTDDATVAVLRAVCMCHGKN